MYIIIPDLKKTIIYKVLINFIYLQYKINELNVIMKKQKEVAGKKTKEKKRSRGLREDKRFNGTYVACMCVCARARVCVCMCIQGSRVNGVCVSDQHQRVRVTERTDGWCGVRPVEFHSHRRERRSSSHRRALVCEPRDRMSRPGIAFPAIPAVRTRHRPDDIESEGGREGRICVLAYP